MEWKTSGIDLHDHLTLYLILTRVNGVISVSFTVVSYLQNFSSSGPVSQQQYVTNILVILLRVLLL
jgi:hypothetical protein